MDPNCMNERGNKSIKNGKNNDDSEYLYSSDSSDYSNVVKMEKDSSRSNSKKCNRLPTRRPDPNVFNRNALMARENRRRKKEYIEMLEKDIEKQREINKKLHKVLKRQEKYVETLKNEKNYFKSILSNNKQILSLVNLLRTVTVKQKPESLSVSSNESFSLQSSNMSPSPQQSESEKYLISKDDNCNDYSFPLNDCNNSLDDLLREVDADSFDMFETNTFEKNSDYNTIHDEHSYYSTSPKPDEELSDSGVCLHISDGKLSLEFCAVCHQNSKKPVIEEF